MNDHSGDEIARDSPSSHRKRKLGLLLILLLCLLAALLLSPLVGSVRVPVVDVIGIELHHLTGGAFPANPCPAQLSVAGNVDSCSTIDTLIVDNRLPEIFLALFVGMGLATVGGTMQGVFRNPLADPYLFGISSGAALGAAATLFVSGMLFQDATLYLPLFAFLGAMGTGSIVLLASRSVRSSPETLLLTGVAVGTLFGGMISLLTTFRASSEALFITFWFLGSFSGATWPMVGLAFAGIAAGSSLLMLHGRDLNLLQLGDETAAGLGADVKSIRRRLILISSFVTAMAVAFCGIVGFVGLISPHVVRRLQGPDYRMLLPASALFGGLFLVLADDLASSVLSGGGILPVGVITAFVGAPFFLWILNRRLRGRAV
jgi:iron complex transport system permease protein